MGPANSDGILVLRPTQGSGYRKCLLRIRDSHPLWLRIPAHSTRLDLRHIPALLPPQSLNIAGLGYSPFARHYLGNHFLFSFPPVNEMFQFAGFASFAGYLTINQVGCPIRIPPSQRL